MSLFSKIALCVCVVVSADAFAVGQLPAPVLRDVRISADAAFSPFGGYVYSYSISNSRHSTGEIVQIQLDVTASESGNAQAGNGFGFTIPLGNGIVDFNTLLFRLQSLSRDSTAPGFFQLGTIVPFGQDVPSGWNGGMGIGGYASFSVGHGSTGILPGASAGGFVLHSFGAPAIRKVNFVPFWMLVVANHEDVTPADMDAAAQVESSIVVSGVTLGASGVSYGSFAHWDQLRDDLAQASALGWISNNRLARTLTSQLASARQAFDARDNFTAKNRLQTVLETINASTPAQRTPEGFALVALNVRSLIDNTPDNETEPKLTITPKTAALTIGSEHTLIATLIDLANGSRPIPGFELNFVIEAGPNAFMSEDATTDLSGRATFRYVGRGAGTDRVLARFFRGEEETVEESAIVDWTGGVDLIVPLFVPPLLITEGGRSFYVTEETQNIGNLPAPATITRYFMSPSEIFDPNTARFVGERNVPALAPEQRSSVVELRFAVPADLGEGMYFLAACSDAASAIVEMSEDNNCSFINVRGQKHVVPIETPNHAPDCTSAVPSVASLWPPNHRMVSVGVEGVSDPERDLLDITVTGITQDEPVDAAGDGNTSPDGSGVGTSEASVRSERSGQGNGRVYVISFSASDGKGGTCSGQVGVGVPHDQGQGNVPIDDGQFFDSTTP